MASFKAKIPSVVFKLDTETLPRVWVVKNAFPVGGVGWIEGDKDGTLVGTQEGFLEGFDVVVGT